MNVSDTSNPFLLSNIASFEPDQALLQLRIAHEMAKKNLVYYEKQRPFLDQQLPALIQSLNDELNHLNHPNWEDDSFERVVKHLCGIEGAYHKLHKIGLEALFKTQFLKGCHSFVDTLYSRIHQNTQLSDHSTLTSLQQEEAELDKLFTVSPSHSHQDTFMYDALRACVFLKWIRDESQK